MISYKNEVSQISWISRIISIIHIISIIIMLLLLQIQAIFERFVTPLFAIKNLAMVLWFTKLDLVTLQL